MCGMYVWQVYSQTMVWELQKDPTQASPSHQPWEDILGGQASIANSRTNCTYDWHTHYQRIYLFRSVCDSLLQIQLHEPPADCFSRIDALKEICLWKDVSLTWNPHQVIPFWQWHLQSKFLGPRLPRAYQSTANNIWCGGCSPHQCTIWEKYPGHSGQCQSYDTPHPTKMVRSHHC